MTSPTSATCALQVGSQARSAAIVLIKWGREYYNTREECCRAMGDVEGCDCTWQGGWTWDKLPPPSSYSALFHDECDGKPSLNRVSHVM
jgi:hypothetical protein